MCASVSSFALFRFALLAAVRNFYLPNRLRLLLSNLPQQQNDEAQGVVILVVEDASRVGLA